MPLTTVTQGQTYVVDRGTTYLVSLSTVSTAKLYLPSTITSGISSGEITYVPPVTETSVVETSIAAAPIPPSTSTSAPPTTSVATTSLATYSTTSALSNSTTGYSNGTATASGATGPTVTHTVKVTQKDTGAIAGAAVGCLIGGALIAGLLTWLIMSGRQKKKHRSAGGFAAGGSRYQSRTNHEKSLPSAPLLGGGVAGNWEKHLDQPESDDSIARSVKGLFDYIEVHVENFYRDAQVKITPELQNALMKVEGSKDLPDSVAGLLPNAQRPTMLIKHCIAHSIIEHIDSESDISDSFLPTDFVALPQALRTRRTTANKPAYNQAYARWRVLSAYLRPKPAEDPNYTHTRDGNIAALADKLCRVFDPWAIPNNFGPRRESLINIMKGGSETGVLLFSQPSTFQWVWRSSSAGAGKGGSLKVVLLPGLVKVRDEEARELDRGVELLRPVVGPISG